MVSTVQEGSLRVEGEHREGDSRFIDSGEQGAEQPDYGLRWALPEAFSENHAGVIAIPAVVIP